MAKTPKEVRRELGIIVTPMTSTELTRGLPKPATKRLDPEMARRKIRSLNQFLREGDITPSQFREMKARVIAQMVGE